MSIEVSSLRQVLGKIAAQASTPSERQNWIPLPKTGSSESELSARIEHLSTLIGEDDGEDNEEVMQRFMALYHLDQQQLMSFLASPPHDLPMPHSAWIDVLERIVTAFADHSSFSHKNAPSLDRALRTEYPFPFEEVFLPFILYARQQYHQQVAMLPNTLISDQAQVMMERWLLQRLSQLAAKTLQLEFSLFRRQYALWGLSPEQRGIYSTFLAQYQGEGLLSLFEEYSVLARLLVLQVEQWIDTCAEFVQHLAADLDEITQTFSTHQSLGSVLQIEIGDSDPHHQGRVVFILTFAADLKLIYKPRCLNIDQAFFDLLTWCNTHGLSLSLKTLHVLSRPSYGWMEYAEYTSCTTQQEIENYYTRTGMLLSLLYVLNGTDMHNSNLMACGEHPVFIDLETVIYPGFPPRLRDRDPANLSPLPDDLDQAPYSILFSGFLPQLTAHGNHACDMSGLGGVIGHTTLHPRSRWNHINTDAMDQEMVQQVKSISFNTVLLQGAPVTPFTYVEHVTTGFRILYSFLVRHSRELLASEGPLSAFEHCPIRFIRRTTAIYLTALDVLRQPEFLRNGTDRWIELQLFKQSTLTKGADACLLEIAELEITALERLDVPWFSTSTESRDLYTDAGMTLINVFPAPALKRVRSCLASLDESDLLKQLELIRSTFLVANPMNITAQETLPSLSEELEGPVLTSEEFVEMARQIAQELQARAFLNLAEDGTWIGLQYDEAMKRFSVRPMGFSLYDGACGIAFFLAAFDTITQKQEYRPLIISALQPLCQNLASAASMTSTHLKKWGIGLASGLSSYMYALTHIGTWLDLPELHEAAMYAAQLLTPELIHADQSFDIMGGNAGAILGLLRLYKTSGQQRLIDQAIQCGDFLLTQRVATKGGARSWLTLDQQPLTGFSHGAAGIAYALLRLSTVTGLPVHREAAEEAIAFEQQVFLPEVGNWPDLRKIDQVQDSVTYATSWCHGAPGIGLARLGGLAILDIPQVHKDLTTALKTTQTFGLPPLDNLCCGNFGRIELLVATSQRLQQPQYQQTAMQWSSVLVQRAREHDGFHLLAQLPRQAYTPGLFQGNAGIGYELLRVAFPEHIPSLLLWD